MKLPNNINFKVVPAVKNPKYLVFSDFDETYLADQRAFENINTLAKQNNLGDPAPEMAGKAQIARFLAAKHGVPYEKMVAFGDSQNNIEMAIWLRTLLMLQKSNTLRAF